MSKMIITIPEEGLSGVLVTVDGHPLGFIESLHIEDGKCQAVVTNPAAHDEPAKGNIQKTCKEFVERGFTVLMKY